MDLIRGLLLGFVYFSCAAAPAPAPAAEENAPTPYTAQQLHDASRVGRTYDFLFEEPGKAAVHHVIQFLDVNDQSTTLRTSYLGEQGQEVKPALDQRATWDELLHHAMFPRSLVLIQAEQVTVPAGTFDCLVYVVHKADGTVNRFDFAKNLPGPPVLFSTEKNGVQQMVSKLVRYEPGR
jgi:hypothetical protein